MNRTSVPGAAGRERIKVVGVAVLIVLSVGAYLGLRSSVFDGEPAGYLLPYQTLARTLVSADQAMYAELQRRYAELERAFVASGEWPPGETLGVRPPYRWLRSEEGLFTNYLGIPPADGSEPAWLIVVQEPDPQAPPDPAPNDETHRRLADGTILHATFWTHRFGGRIAPGFVRQPETAGWTQVLTAPVAQAGN